MRIQYSRERGFTLLEIMIVVAIIGLLAAIAIPTSVRARATSQTNTCINNLREVEGATQIWALEAKKRADAPVAFDDIRDYLKRLVTCPAGGADATFATSYELHGIVNRPTCRILPEAHVLPVENSN